MNLDGIDADELWDLHNRLRQHVVAEARELSPDRPQGYIRAARTFQNYAANKATAMTRRAEGEVSTAMIYERICDRLYGELPDFARW